MKKIRFLLIVIILLFTACNSVSKIEQTENQTIFYEFRKLNIDILKPLKTDNSFVWETIEYFNSQEVLNKVDILKSYYDKLSNLPKSKENSELLVSAKSSLDVLDKILFYAKQFKTTGIYKVDEISEKENIDLSGAMVGSQTIIEAKMKYIDEYEGKSVKGLSK